jgi:hypothetical protein
MKSDWRAADLNRVAGEEVRNGHQNVNSGRSGIRTTYKAEDDGETENCNKLTVHRAFTVFLDYSLQSQTRNPLNWVFQNNHEM